MPSGVESTRVHISALDRGLSAGHQTGESAGVSPGGTIMVDSTLVARQSGFKQYRLSSLMLLILVISLAIGWWLDHRDITHKLEVAHEQHVVHTVSLLLDAARTSSDYAEQAELLTLAAGILSVVEPPSYRPRIGRLERQFQDLHQEINRIWRERDKEQRLERVLPLIRKAQEEPNQAQAAKIKNDLMNKYPELVDDQRLRD